MPASIHGGVLAILAAVPASLDRQHTVDKTSSPIFSNITSSELCKIQVVGYKTNVALHASSGFSLVMLA